MKRHDSYDEDVDMERWKFLRVRFGRYMLEMYFLIIIKESM